MSNNRVEAAFRRELLSAEGRRMLSLLESCPLDKLDIAKEENGRPFFPDRRADFNISHSGNMAAVSLVKSLAYDGVIIMRTGCDIELVRARPNAKKIAGDFFTGAERDYIFAQDETVTEQARFFEIWTLKECFLKLRGLSVFDMADVPSFIKGDAEGRLHFAFCGAASSPLSFNLYELSGPGEHYVLASVIEGAGQLQPEMRWFSPSFLAARSIAAIKAEISPPETVRAKM